MSTATQENLLQTSRFGVEIDGVLFGLFKECSGLDSTNEIIEYKSVGGGGKLFTQKVPGHTNFSDITLKQSLDGTSDMWDWRQQVENGEYDKYRRDGSIVLYDEKGDEQARYKFTAGWPSSWKFSDLDAGADDIVIQEMVIAHEGISKP